MLSKYCVSFKEKIEVQKLIANKETKMKKQRETYQKEQRDPRWDKLEKLVGG